MTGTFGKWLRNLSMRSPALSGLLAFCPSSEVAIGLINPASSPNSDAIFSANSYLLSTSAPAVL